jgi:hypothetical protein
LAASFVISTTLIAAALIAIAVFFHGYLTQYILSAAGNDGQTVWRIDGSTGQVSVCGTMLSGSALSQASELLKKLKIEPTQNFSVFLDVRAGQRVRGA